MTYELDRTAPNLDEAGDPEIPEAVIIDYIGYNVTPKGEEVGA